MEITRFAPKGAPYTSYMLNETRKCLKGQYTHQKQKRPNADKALASSIQAYLHHNIKRQRQLHLIQVHIKIV